MHNRLVDQMAETAAVDSPFCETTGRHEWEVIGAHRSPWVLWPPTASLTYQCRHCRAEKLAVKPLVPLL